MRYRSIMLFSHSGEYPCKCKNLIFAANSPKMIRLARRIRNPLPMFRGFTFIHQAILNSQDCFIHPSFATFCLHSYGWMLANPYKYLMITTNALLSIRMSCDCLRKCFFFAVAKCLEKKKLHCDADDGLQWVFSFC